MLSGGIGLVDVEIAEELASGGTDVADLPGHVSAELLLVVEVVVLHVRRAQTLVDGEGVFKYSILGRVEDLCWTSCHDGIDAAEIEQHIVVGWPGVKCGPRKLSGEEVLRKGVVIHAPSCAEHGLPCSEDVVSHAETGTEIVPVLGIEFAGSAGLTDELERARAIDEAELVVLFADDAVVIPTQSPVEGEALSEAPVVLNVEAVAVFVGLAVGAA